ncbi:amidase [Peribacillus cavernae]|uniref:Amidase n=1 Tax=Peribacillus cavernae TaxID=1674310 RepID=A0A433HII3_9BACI|nr:amidase family protein [Peribacillus cavernae]MDQ0217718.1 Asp-tRNA(Asn)/Glu-tRNA(Gln) amidotransferase A subunit family amidase [Peribacillus cavernae]RUQ28184.1 amidase [Peribacillus cavernae]
MNIANMTALEIRNVIAEKEISAVEVMSDTLTRMNALEPALNAFVTTTPDLAMEAAKATDKAIMSGKPLGLLQGIPISVKDLINVGGIKTTFGSRTRVNNLAAADAPSVERVRNAGAGIIGKTTTTEFGSKAGSSDSPLTGVTSNPWNLEKTTGGSSAGAAASVAAGITPFALGTDGGGSVRIPSALCGLFGIKAQFGRVPVFPTSATPTLAHVGVLSRTVRDAALLMQVISGYESRDPASVSESVPNFIEACDLPIKGLRIAWSPTLGYAKPTPEVRMITENAVRRFEDMGCSVELVEKVFDDPIDLWMADFYAGIGVTLKDENSDLLDPALAGVLQYALDESMESYYSKVFKRYSLHEKVRQFFQDYDLLLTPTLPVSSINAGVNVPPNLLDRNMVSWSYYTYPFNLTGNPAASIPCGIDEEGMPVGLQMVAGFNREVDILQAAACFEASYPWENKMPILA